MVVSFLLEHEPLQVAKDNLVSKPEFTVAFNLAATDSFSRFCV